MRAREGGGGSLVSPSSPCQRRFGFSFFSLPASFPKTEHKSEPQSLIYKKN